jgi:elongator complex protein 6
MTSNSRIPQHLAPYVDDVPKDSLILLTSTLSNSVNWLIVRCLCVPLSNEAIKARRVAPSQEELGESTNAVTDDVGVVLVSWMRDWEFWRTEARRAVVSRAFTCAYGESNYVIAGP